VKQVRLLGDALFGGRLSSHAIWESRLLIVGEGLLDARI
jgi:hypothetical protein